MERKASGKLYIIGGHESKSGAPASILEEIAQQAIRRKGSVVIFTVASSEPEAMADGYTRLFSEMGVSNVEVLDIRTHGDADDEANLKKLEGAEVIFFTGGDQLRITSQIGDSRIHQAIQAHLREGRTVAGTSAGAAAMPNTMIIGGGSEESNQVSTLSMGPGLGLVEGVVIDSHFAERGRLGRLLGAVVQNSMNIGLGIDEDTAVIFDEKRRFRVAGSGAVYVVDGRDISYSSLSDENPEGVITMHDVRLHVLSAGARFDLKAVRPLAPDGGQYKSG